MNKYFELMIKNLANLFSFFFVRFYLIILIGGNIFLWLAVYYINKTVSQDLVALHYNINFGVDLIGHVNKIFIIPSISLLTILLNTILIFILQSHKHFKFIAYLLLSACVMINLFLLLGLMSIYLVNFR